MKISAATIRSTLRICGPQPDHPKVDRYAQEMPLPVQATIDHVPQYPTLHNFVPPATEEETRRRPAVRRKVAGFRARRRTPAFEEAVETVAGATQRLVDRLVTSAPPKTREVEQARARERWQRRISRAGG
jgi:hypothetical protein